MAYEIKNKTPNPQFENVYDVSPQEVFDHRTELTLIDVREPQEYTGELGHIDSAQLVVLHTLPEKLKEIPTDKPIVFVCRSGARSGQASAFAAHHGLKNTFNMQGGMILWNRLQLPITTT